MTISFQDHQGRKPCSHDSSSLGAGKSAKIGELPKGKVGPLAQLVEQRTFNPWVDGSSPSGPTVNFLALPVFFLKSITRTSFLRSLFGSSHSTTLEFPEAQIITPGTASGITSGGNLAMLVSSLGTNSSWLPESRILMIEDEEESDIRIDRMLTQLRRSGFFESVVGVIAGHFYNCGNPLDVRWVLEDNLARLGIPLLIGANIGHRGNFQTYPIGVFASLALENKVLLLERTALTTK